MYTVVRESYEFTRGDFNGEVATPWIDRFGPDPGPGWDPIQQPPSSLQYTALVVLHRGNAEQELPGRLWPEGTREWRPTVWFTERAQLTARDRRTTEFSRAEEEVIFLRAVTDLVDSMVNFSLFHVGGTSPDASILFHTATHQRFFNILLVDLLSTSDERLVGRRVSYLEALRQISTCPSFDVGNSVAKLRAATSSFVDWLDHKPIVKVWLPSVDTDAQLAIPRKSFLTICGNISKHSMLRQSRPAQELRDLLKGSGVWLTLDEAVLALEDFYERFHTDIFNYHAATIAEFLNEIRWGVHEYLLPEYQRSYTPKGGDPPRYSFSYPAEIQQGLPKALYWDLMNDVRRGPICERFAVTKYLKMRY